MDSEHDAATAGAKKERDRDRSLRTPGKGIGRAACVLLLGSPALLIVASAVVLSLGFTNVVREDYTFVERVQVGGWVLIGLGAAFGCLRQRLMRGVFLLWWIGVAAMLCGVRELDFQVLVNPENIHLLGLSEDAAIRWNLTWWGSADVPLGVKAAWAALLFTAGTAVILPFALAGFPWPARLLGRDRFAWLLALGFGLLFAGLLFDDLVGRRSARAGYDLSLIEELMETAGVACVLGWTAWLALGSPDLLSSRERETWGPNDAA